MIPDYNHDGKIDRYDREMYEIMLEEEEREREEWGNQDIHFDGWEIFFIIGMIILLKLFFFS